MKISDKIFNSKKCNICYLFVSFIGFFKTINQSKVFSINGYKGTDKDKCTHVNTFMQTCTPTHSLHTG